jgi:hypothetical protein
MVCGGGVLILGLLMAFILFGIEEQGMQGTHGEAAGWGIAFLALALMGLVWLVAGVVAGEECV